MSAILEWLAPLAHNMIRWQSERSFEQQRVVSRSNVLLVQTLYFANQEKTEAAITELLVGLNYVWTYSRELNAKALQECASSRVFDECLDLEGIPLPHHFIGFGGYMVAKDFYVLASPQGFSVLVNNNDVEHGQNSYPLYRNSIYVNALP
ncbi:hypothetical protein WN944_015950 [Citrus x changshan-huyou]|uniref:Uncharacterized protein n=1 Tax=Citrus x changshan-huyou TaxID=2935761 RepID=A0AAP0QRJ5_9ROSI